MSMALIPGALWVLAAAAVALLPMRHQMLPGAGLLVAAPLLIGLIWMQAGPGWALFGLFAVGSMFRRPLIALARRARTPAEGRA
ncbi:DUF2484 family protein [Paracoccaceae bacterium Fryx2]|nr:DUF2484 family protein [Paracoccaceae bacterium Fryx2]